VPKLGSEESIRVQRLQSEMVALQRQIAQKDEEYNKKCTVVKQELDKLKSDYAACSQSCKQLRLQAQSGNVPSESEQSAVNRIKDLEKQVLTSSFFPQWPHFLQHKGSDFIFFKNSKKFRTIKYVYSHTFCRWSICAYTMLGK